MRATRAWLTLSVTMVMVAAGCSSSSSSAAPKPSPTTAATKPSPTTAAPSGFDLAVAHPTVWLCRPGMAANPCSTNLDTTVVQPGGGRSTAPFIAAKHPKIDCFYVYPTLSQAKTDAAPLAPEPAAVGVANAQASRFQSVCRLFVPVYRQLTSAGLARAIKQRRAPAGVLAQATADVVSAWHDYLDHYNDGRGVVLLGHSQGAGQVISLLKTEVDSSPAEKARLVSAIALGGNLLVPQGKDVGGDLKSIPACRAATQRACVVAYSMFSSQPPAGAYFGRATSAIGHASTAGMQVLCVNPGALAGGTAVLHPYLPTRKLAGLAVTGQAALPNLPTPFVTYAGLLKGTCEASGGASWLQISSPTAAGKALIAKAQTLGPLWGLHLVDFNAAEGDLVDLVTREAAAWK